jgi:hypothetical protein
MTLKRDAIRAAIRTFLQAWGPLLVLALTGWGHDITEWLGDSGRPFPAVPPVVKVAVSLLPALLAGVVSLVHNLLPIGKQAVYLPSEAIKGKPAQDEAGYGAIEALVTVVVLLVLVVVIFKLLGAVG